MTIETKNSAPSSAEILNYATAFGIALALGILAMTVGLIRSETARDLRTLTATGASSFARRELTAATAFALRLGQPARRPVRTVQRAHHQPADHPDRHADDRRGGRLAAGRTRAARDRAP